MERKRERERVGRKIGWLNVEFDDCSHKVVIMVWSCALYIVFIVECACMKLEGRSPLSFYYMVWFLSLTEIKIQFSIPIVL